MKKDLLKTKYFSAKRLATLGVLTAMGLITFMIESLFPPLFVPGAKMGLSNIFSMLAVILLGPTDAFVLVAVRTVLGSLFSGNVSTLMYSLTAGLVSVIVTSVLVEFVYPKVSIVAISVVSAVMHNLTQNIVFCLVSNTPQMFVYMPLLGLTGVLAGVIVGFAVWFILKMIPTRTFATMLDLDFSQDVTKQEQKQEEQTEQTELQEDLLSPDAVVEFITDKQQEQVVADEQQIIADQQTNNDNK